MDQTLNNIDLTRIISELTQNSIDAGCSLINIEVNITSQKKSNKYTVIVTDNGTISGTLDEFCNKGISFKGSSGLGLYYINEFCKNNGGSLHIDRNNKTKVRLSYETCLQDELNGLEEVLYLLSINEIQLHFELIREEFSFVYDTRKIKDILKEVSIKELKVMKFLKEYIRDGLNQK